MDDELAQGLIDRVDALEEQVDELQQRNTTLEQKLQDLEMRYEAVINRNKALKRVVLGDLETAYDDVHNSASVWRQLLDMRAAVSNHGERIDRLDSAGARGQPGAARVAKIRHSLVKRATKRGTVTTAQAAQQKSPALDYEDVLALFDFEISDTYATKLLNKAADGGAFWVKDPPNARDGRKTLRVDLTELEEDSPYLRNLSQQSGEEATEDFAEFGNSEIESGGR